MTTRLIAITAPMIDGAKTPEELIAYCARVSNPSNQENHATAPKLLAYCMKHGHWSVFEQASMTVEIETSRAIAAQILRHRSFFFQEFSQRYSDISKLGLDIAEIPELRAANAAGNRQGSGEDIGDQWWLKDFVTLNDQAKSSIDSSISIYKALIGCGVAPESARMVLPLCTKTRIYMNGSVRSWIHYFEQRCSEHTQKEHREIAISIRDTIFAKQFPVISQLLTK